MSWWNWEQEIKFLRKQNTDCWVTHIPTSCCVLNFVQGATLGLDVAEVQFDARDHDLGMTGTFFFHFAGLSNWMEGELKHVLLPPSLPPFPARNNPRKIVPILNPRLINLMAQALAREELNCALICLFKGIYQTDTFNLLVLIQKEGSMCVLYFRNKSINGGEMNIYKLHEREL